MTRRLFGAVGACVLVLAACGGSFDRETAIDELEDDFGLDNATAVCVTDTVIDEVGLERLDELTGDSEPTTEESITLIEAFEACGSGASAIVDDDDIADFAAALDVSDPVARCVFDDLGVEFFELFASGEDPDSEIVGQMFDSIAVCGG